MKKTLLLSAGALALVTATGAHAAKGKAKPAPKKAPAKAAKKVEKKEPLALSKTNLGALTLTGLVDTRIILTDDGGPAAAGLPAGTVVGAGKSRYMGTGTDSRVLFRATQASLGAQLKTAPKWTLKTQLDFDLEGISAANAAQGTSKINIANAYMEGAGVLGENGTLAIGVIPAPIMGEMGGALGSGELTLTPGAVGSLINIAVVEGVAGIWSGKGDEVNGTLTVGLFNNLDALGAGAAPAGGGQTSAWFFNDSPGDTWRTLGDVDGDIGFWVSGFLGDDDNIVMGNVAYVNNGGDEKVAGAADSDLWTVGLEAHPGEGWTLKGQYLDGDSTTNNAAGTARVNADWKAWYLLASYKGEDTRVTVRYDDFSNDHNAGNTVAAPNRGDEEDGNAWTVALKHDLDGNQQIGLEYLWIDNDPTFNLGAATTRVADAEDNLLQLSYKWFF